LEWVASKHLENATKTQVGFPWKESMST
jgi:hypothetical protein